eukprot:Seg1974.3 transcript_id=Seg1974.3/GoldUCD/mRNA.D3Y31 product="Cysteine-rich motor neuron 1 protein" protein_id=Seg1974.3/GoldUCD/D3Y31
MDMLNMKYLISVVLIATLGILFCKQASSLTCLNCEEQKCRDIGSLRCQGGTTLDVCGCCTVCAKVEGEACGGPWNLKGVCDKGLKCKPKSDLRPGNCVDPSIKKGLPRCIQRRKYPRGSHYFRLSRYRACMRKTTIFCEKCCNRCCEHDTTCNPDMYTYIQKTRCQRQQRLYLPSKLISGDEADDENEVEDVALEEDIKG